MKKCDYDSKMLDAICEGPFTELKIDGRWKDYSPLNKMITQVTTVLKTMVKDHKMSKRQMLSLIVPNPKMAIAYGVPKVHKRDNKMRIIIRYSQSPTEKVSKWVQI